MKLDISLDVERVQPSVQAAIRPAVESALKSVDVEKKIKAILLAKREKGKDDRPLAGVLEDGVI